MQNKRLTNHIALVVDQSGSMSGLARKVVAVFDGEIAYLRQRSIDLDQETRVSIYLFDSVVENIAFDVDVMRIKSLEGQYRTGGQTALIDATARAIDEMKRIPELHSDHAFLVYVLTDGQENASTHKARGTLSGAIAALPDHWTIVVQVPDALGIHEAKKFGFPAGNIQVWDTTSSTGLESAAKSTRSAIDSYMTARATGIRGTRTFFTTDMGGVKAKDVTAQIERLKPAQYSIYGVRKKIAIQPFVESWEKVYVKGSAYYELMKPETIQAYKQVCVQNRKNGKVYGGDNARQLLKLPAFEVRVAPGDHGDWRIFVQSTSLNRWLVPGTQLLVMK